MYKANGREAPPEVALEWQRNLTAIYNNLGLCFIQLDDFESARRALAEARLYAETSRDSAGLSLVYHNLAQLEEATGGEADLILRLLRSAKALAKDCGMAQTIYQSNTKEAETLISMAEYDETYTRLVEAEQYVQINGGMEGRLALELTLADLALRRGGLDAAREKFRACVALTEGLGAPTLADKIRFKFCLYLGFHFRREALDELDRLAAKHRDCVACAVSLESVEDVTRILSNEQNPVEKPPLSFRFDGRDDEESQVRMEIALCEYEQDLASLPPSFQWLCAKKFEEGNPDRLLNLANAFFAAAERARNPEKCAVALNYIGVARDMLGDTRGALNAFRSALATDGLPLSLQNSLKLNCALAQSKGSEPAGAEALFRELIADHRERGDFDDQIHAMRALAKHFQRQERFHEAVAQLEEALTFCKRSTQPETREAVEEDLKKCKRRLEAHASGSFRGRDSRIIVEGAEGRKQLDAQQLAALRAQAKTAEEIVNLGLLAADSGLMQEARDLTEEALSRFNESGDQLGASRCWSNLGAWLT